MINRLGTVVAAVLISASGALAAPIGDTADWLQRFTVSALKSDPGEMIAQVREVAAPGLNADALKTMLDKVMVVVGSEPGQFAEQFGQQSIGTFLRRTNVAVRYPTTILYYTIVFARDEHGWQLMQFNYNTDINAVLALRWPS